MYQWLQLNRSFVRIVSVFLLFMAAAIWLPTELPQPLADYEPAVKLTPPMLRLPALQVNLLFSQNSGLRADALEITKKDLVKYLRPDNTADEWSIQAAEIYLGDSTRQWVVAALSLSSKEGLICVLVPQDQQYTLFYTQSLSAPIISIQSLPSSTNTSTDEYSGQFLLVTQAPEENSITPRTTTWGWKDSQLRLCQD
jgi:hypothetical protein